MKKMMEKYPVDDGKGKQLLKENQEKLYGLWSKCNEVLERSPARQVINHQELKMILENHRLEMHLQTTDLLQELEFVDDVHLKRLYNYNLATNRNNYESMLEVTDEFI